MAKPNAVSSPDDVLIKEYRFFCKALGREVPYSLFLPKSEGSRRDSFPVLLLLHGDGRTHRTIADDSVCRREILKRNFAIIFPNGDRSWYLDSKTDRKSHYQSMLRELLDHVRSRFPVYKSSRYTGICGWSMGGFGAVHFAETFPEEIGAVATTIGLLDYPNPQLPADQNYPVSAVFGTDTTDWARVNCRNNAAVLRGKHLLFIAGTQAFDYRMNQNFHRKLQQFPIDHTYLELDGKHDFEMVRKSIPLLLDFFQKNLP
ncbi:alpha/beta hydrolase [Larkinella rosea]|uniref:alpha/beta hydrolase n=1 Tax=Larkinella rosea TaxID=2025312 RepID=UPI0016395765|nr:alpha/beta hydrolase-fold protein [Larkinella rosea]